MYFKIFSILVKEDKVGSLTINDFTSLFSPLFAHVKIFVFVLYKVYFIFVLHPRLLCT